MSMKPELFSVRIEQATIIPDDNALREFAEQFRQEQEKDPELQERFELNPELVLAERGVALDIQRELLVSSGLAGAEMLAESCHICTCCITNPCSHAITIVICKGAATTVHH